MAEGGYVLPPARCSVETPGALALLGPSVDAGQVMTKELTPMHTKHIKKELLQRQGHSHVTDTKSVKRGSGNTYRAVGRLFHLRYPWSSDTI